MCEKCGFLIFLLHGQRPRYFFGRKLRERFQGVSKTSSLNYAQVRSSRVWLSNNSARSWRPRRVDTKSRKIPQALVNQMWSSLVEQSVGTEIHEYDALSERKHTNHTNTQKKHKDKHAPTQKKQTHKNTRTAETNKNTNPQTHKHAKTTKTQKHKHERKNKSSDPARPHSWQKCYCYTAIKRDNPCTHGWTIISHHFAVVRGWWSAICQQFKINILSASMASSCFGQGLVVSYWHHLGLVRRCWSAIDKRTKSQKYKHQSKKSKHRKHRKSETPKHRSTFHERHLLHQTPFRPGMSYARRL